MYYVKVLLRMLVVTSLCGICLWRGVTSAEVELSSLKQRLEEATAVSQALRLELQLSQRLAQSTDNNKENQRGTQQSLAVKVADEAATPLPSQLRRPS